VGGHFLGRRKGLQLNGKNAKINIETEISCGISDIGPGPNWGDWGKPIHQP